MEKTITIDGREVKFKSAGGTLMRYRNQFNREFMNDFALLAAMRKGDTTGASFALVDNMVWALAKTADPSIPDPQTWYDSFSEINTMELWEELAELVAETLKPMIKHMAKNVKAAAGQTTD